MNLSAENIEQIRELVRSGYPLKARHAQDLLGHNDHITELLEARFRLMLSVEIERDQLKAENEALRKDAERYRMVRDIASISASRRHLVVKRRPVNGFGSSTARDFDASIDAAMGKGEQS